MVRDEQIKEIVIKILRESFFDYYSKVQKKTRHLVLDRLLICQHFIGHISNS